MSMTPGGSYSVTGSERALVNVTVMDDSPMAHTAADGTTVDSDARQIMVGIESEGDGADVGMGSGAAAS